jgi:hypothetical protein
MISTSISPNLSVIEQARYYLSPEYLTQYCLSYYFTVCAYNSHWVEVHYGQTNQLQLEANSQSKQHALNFIKSDQKLKEILKLLGLGDLKLNLRNLGTVKKTRTLQSNEDVVAISIETRTGRLWEKNKAYEVIAALPSEKRLISVSTSNLHGVNIQDTEDDEIPSFIETRDINTTGLVLKLRNVKLPPYVSKGRIISEGSVSLVGGQNDNRIWKLDFLLRTVEHADTISNSLKTQNDELNFDHLLLLSHPTEHGKTILGQYYLAPISVSDYDYEQGKEISQRVIRQINKDSVDNFYITSKLGRRIERAFERNSEVYIIALVKQYFGQNTKRILDYIIVEKKEYLKALDKAVRNQREKGVKYYPLKDLLQIDNSCLDVKFDFLEKGFRVQHRKEKKWGIGTVLGFRKLEDGRVVARIDFQYGGLREILCGDYFELIDTSVKQENKKKEA